MRQVLQAALYRWHQCMGIRMYPRIFLRQTKFPLRTRSTFPHQQRCLRNNLLPNCGRLGYDSSNNCSPSTGGSRLQCSVRFKGDMGLEILQFQEHTWSHCFARAISWVIFTIWKELFKIYSLLAQSTFTRHIFENFHV